MPNPDAMQKAAERRRARDDAKRNNAEQAAAEATNLSDLLKQNAAAKTDEPLKPKPKIDRKTKQALARRDAAEQADRDAAVVAELPEDRLDLSYYRARGEEPPLHVLNAIAKRDSMAIKDDARELARAVGKVAYEEATGFGERQRHTRMKRVNVMLSEQAKAKAKAGKE